MNEREETQRYPVNRAPHLAEWMIGAASAAGVLALVGYLVVTALAETGGPPVFEPRADEIFPSQGVWHARVTLRNSGDKTAADVVLQGAAGNGETSEITFDYVPAGSTRTGALLFEAEPSELKLLVRSYTDP